MSIIDRRIFDLSHWSLPKVRTNGRRKYLFEISLELTGNLDSYESNRHSLKSVTKLFSYDT